MGLEQRDGGFEGVLEGDGAGGGEMAAAFGAGIAGLGAVNVCLIMNAVLAGVRPFIDEPFLLQTLPQLLRSLLVPGLSGADKVVVGDAHLLK